jgi:hypothetical protein
LSEVGTIEQRARGVGQLAMRLPGEHFILTEATLRPGMKTLMELTDVLNLRQAEQYLDRAERKDQDG